MCVCLATPRECRGWAINSFFFICWMEKFPFHGGSVKLDLNILKVKNVVNHSHLCLFKFHSEVVKF